MCGERPSLYPGRPGTGPGCAPGFGIRRRSSRLQTSIVPRGPNGIRTHRACGAVRRRSRAGPNGEGAAAHLSGAAQHLVGRSAGQYVVPPGCAPAGPCPDERSEARPGTFPAQPDTRGVRVVRIGQLPVVGSSPALRSSGTLTTLRFSPTSAARRRGRCSCSPPTVRSWQEQSCLPLAVTPCRRVRPRVLERDGSAAGPRTVHRCASVPRRAGHPGGSIANVSCRRSRRSACCSAAFRPGRTRPCG